MAGFIAPDLILCSSEAGTQSGHTQAAIESSRQLRAIIVWKRQASLTHAAHCVAQKESRIYVFH